MTLKELQQEMIAAMKSGDKFRKDVISTTIAQIKNVAIDKGCRDDIPESLVSETLLKTKKMAQEMIDTCPESRQDLLENYKKQMQIICEFAPKVINDEEKIRKMILDSGVFVGKSSKGMVMKYLKSGEVGIVDMKVAAKVFEELVKQ